MAKVGDAGYRGGLRLALTLKGLSHGSQGANLRMRFPRKQYSEDDQDVFVASDLKNRLARLANVGSFVCHQRFKVATLTLSKI